MDNKEVIIAVIILVMVIVGVVTLLRVREPGTEIFRNITFWDECTKDEDCGYSYKTCGVGFEVGCENSCVRRKCINCTPICRKVSKCYNVTCPYSVKVCPNGRIVKCKNYCDLYGRCTKCIPKCQLLECYNESCLDSVKVCRDGRTATCLNYCDVETGKCTSCMPECNITVEDAVNLQLKAGEFVVDAVPCVNMSFTERREVKLIEKELSKIKLPAGYSIIIEPFSVNQDGPLDLTLNIPETYTDVQALRCRRQDCNGVMIRYVKELRCEGEIIEEYLMKQDYLEPRLMLIKIKEMSFNITPDLEIRNDKYKVRFNGDFKNLDVTLSMPIEAVEEAKNPSLKITGTPLVIKIKGKVEENVNSTVTMPYINLEGFEEDSMGMYVKIKQGWDYIGGEINKEDKTVTATIINVSNYLDENNEIKVALMAVLCISCYGSSLTKVYQPEKGSTNAVILVHGFNPDPNTYQPLIDEIRLTNQPFEVWTFDYPWSRPVRENMGELMSLLEKNHANYKNIYIVAHSLGGIIAQEALYNSYLENKKSLKNKQPLMYSYLNKIRKIILVGAPNEGSPVVEVYRNLFKSLVNKGGKVLFNPTSPVIDEMVKGVITPSVPGIDYNVIAGTKLYGFNLLFFEVTTEKLAGMYEKNDGIITVKSAQHIGDRYVNDTCKNYWELNLTHTELIDDSLARRIIGKIISKDISKKDTAILGYNRYFELSVRDSEAGDTYIIIGKKIKEDEVFDETGCSCGNGYCGEGENEINCPSDCAIFLSKNNEGLLFMVIVLVTFFICREYIIRNDVK